MRIFLIGFTSDVLIGVAEELKQKGADIVYWSLNLVHSSARRLKRQDFPKTIFHHGLDAVKARPAPGVDSSNFKPIGKELISKLYQCESQVLTMMDRMDYINVPVHRRKRLYYKLLKYWQGVLEQLKPDVIIFSEIPHMVYDFVLYHLAREFAVKTIIIEPTNVPNRLLLLGGIAERNELLLNELSKTEKLVKLADLSEDLKNYYLKMTEGKQTCLSYRPDYIYRSRKNVYLPYKPNLRLAWQRLKKGDFLGLFKSIKNYLIKTKKVFASHSYLTSFDNDFIGSEYVKEIKRWEKVKKRFKREYRKLEQSPQLNKKFIFVPLHYQPEKSTNPMAGVFTDQLLMLKILAKALPEDWLIYLKEHPAQWAKGGVHGQQGRYEGYYKEIVEEPNVKLLPLKTSGLELILKSQAVATITGTAGLEALFLQKPVLLFGSPVYEACEGVFKIASLQDCREAMNKIIGGYKPDKQKVLNFLAALDRISIKAYQQERFSKEGEISSIDAVKNISQALWRELQKDEPLWKP